MTDDKCKETGLHSDGVFFFTDKPDATEALKNYGYQVISSIDTETKQYAGEIDFLFIPDDHPISKQMDLVKAYYPNATIKHISGQDLVKWAKNGRGILELAHIIDSGRIYQVAPEKVILGGICAADLLKKEFADPKWAVKNILPEGLNILGGKPKGGKSLMALNIGIAIASGGVALGVKVDPGEVIYLALEDTQRRLKDRTLKMLGPDTTTDLKNLHFYTEFPRMGSGGLSHLESLISPDTRLIIIDTFALFRPPEKPGGNSYSTDYEHISKIKQLADRKSTSVLVIHHLRKMGASDVFDLFSGTLGLTGAADGLLALIRKGSNITLHITGRDLEGAELAMKLNPQFLTWNVLGKAEEVRSTDQQQVLFDCLKNAEGKALKVQEIKAMTGLGYNYIQKTLLLLMEKNSGVYRLKRGQYLYLKK